MVNTKEHRRMTIIRETHFTKSRVETAMLLLDWFDVK